MARATRGCPLTPSSPQEAAKEALWSRRNLVESEVSSLGIGESQAGKCGRVPHPDPGHSLLALQCSGREGQREQAAPGELGAGLWPLYCHSLGPDKQTISGQSTPGRTHSPTGPTCPDEPPQQGAPAESASLCVPLTLGPAGWAPETGLHSPGVHSPLPASKAGGWLGPSPSGP